MFYSLVDYFYLVERVYLTFKTWEILSYDKKTKKELLLIQWINLIVSNLINNQLQEEPFELVLFLIIIHGVLFSNFYNISTLLLEQLQMIEFKKYFEIFKQSLKIFSTVIVLKFIKTVLKLIVPSEEFLNDPNYNTVNQSLLDISRYIDKGDKSMIQGDKSIVQNESRFLPDDVLDQSIQRQSQPNISRSQSLFIDTPKSPEGEQYFEKFNPSNDQRKKNNAMLYSTRSTASDKDDKLERRKSLNSMVSMLEELDKEDQSKVYTQRIKEERPKYIPFSSQYALRPPKFNSTSSQNQVDDLFKKLAEQKGKLQQMKQQ